MKRGIERPDGSILLGGCTYDRLGRRLLRCDVVVKLSPRTAVLLDVLVTMAGHVVSKEDLTGAHTEGAPATANGIHKSMVELRQAFSSLGEDFNAVETIPRRGYRLTLTVAGLADERLDRAVDSTGSIPAEDVSQSDRLEPPAVPVESLAFNPVRTRWLAAVCGVILSCVALFAVWRIQTAAESGTKSETKYSEASAPHTALRTRVMVALVSVSGTDAATIETGRSLEGLVVDALRLTPGIEVVGRDPAASRNKEADGYRIELNVQKADGNHIVDVVILRSLDETLIQSKRYEIALDAAAELKARIAGDMISVSEILFDPRELEAMWAGGTRDALAWRAWIDARSIRDVASIDALQSAIVRLNEALRIDPAFTLARVELRGTLLEQLRLETAAPGRQEIEAGLRQQDLELTTQVGELPDVSFLVAADFRANARTLRDMESLIHRSLLASKDCDCAGPHVAEYASLLLSAGLNSEAAELLESAETLLDALRYPVSLHREEAAARAAPDALRETRLRSLLRRHPEHPAALFDLAILLLRQSRAEEASPLIEQLKSAAGESDWYNVARTLWDHDATKTPAAVPANNEARHDKSAFLVGLEFWLKGDVQSGVATWSRLDSHAYKELLMRVRDLEPFFETGVVGDPRYQDVLELLGIGASWADHLRTRNLEVGTTVQRLLADEADKLPNAGH